jgi:hypothetical protein
LTQPLPLYWNDKVSVSIITTSHLKTVGANSWDSVCITMKVHKPIALHLLYTALRYIVKMTMNLKETEESDHVHSIYLFILLVSLTRKCMSKNSRPWEERWIHTVYFLGVALTSSQSTEFISPFHTVCRNHPNAMYQGELTSLWKYTVHTYQVSLEEGITNETRLWWTVTFFYFKVCILLRVYNY